MKEKVEEDGEERRGGGGGERERRKGGKRRRRSRESTILFKEKESYCEEKSMCAFLPYPCSLNYGACYESTVDDFLLLDPRNSCLQIQVPLQLKEKNSRYVEA
jgi:hypothetical protein